MLAFSCSLKIKIFIDGKSVEFIENYGKNQMDLNFSA